MHTGVCVYGWMDATWRAMPTYVETDDHVRVSTSVRIWRARLSGADKGARRPTGHPGARAPGLYRPRCLCVSTSVCLWRAPLPAGLPPKGPRQLVTGHPPPTRPRRTRPPRGASHRANSASQLAAALPTARPPARLPSLLPPSSPSLARAPCRSSPAPAPGPYDGARARGSLLATSARARPNSLDLDLLDPRARASDGPSLTHTHRPRPAPIVRANVPGSESRSGGGPLSLADRAPPTRPCAPANWPPPFVTRRRRARALLPVRARARPSRTANWRGPMEGGDPREPVVAGPPRLRRRVSGPLQAPGAAGPVGGRCLPTNLAKDRADAQRLVATRLLDRLHDPLGHFSRLQRIHPRAR
ncbi:hypothetical protein P174DRAFT_479267 [Aspergillus novofumigatus IBT 16806]|uniref:Uncharacterized protein n=1 Tax=Aspergillus novofumigatus (strain IBT 16806) TaxID=1392255 RepID=A0A2I1BS94_ASPN1|nr:hypothetical protein P174DRAFT_479267 [Aspergillus novofumigatus IBT 16806]